jgi:hypothetical protein
VESGAAMLVTRELDGQHVSDERSAVVSPGRGGSGMRVNALSHCSRVYDPDDQHLGGRECLLSGVLRPAGVMAMCTVKLSGGMIQTVLGSTTRPRWSSHRQSPKRPIIAPAFLPMKESSVF